MAASSGPSGRKAESTEQEAGDRISAVQASLSASSATNTHQEPPSAAPSGTVEATTGNAVEEALPILPTGFVENTAEIYREVASFDIIPPEKLREYWHVYTITHKKLYDPTANRLENFWWHVWGSQRRNLSGRTVARLYKEISTGPTFVPLRTPANRYDGPTIPNVGPALVLGQPEAVTSSGKAETEVSQAKDSDDKAIEDTGPEDQKQVPASSSRPAPAQSILRKPRPSLSGPRPAPRFDLPSGNPPDTEGGGDATPAAVAGHDTGLGNKKTASVASGSDEATTVSAGSERDNAGKAEAQSEGAKDDTPDPSSSVSKSKAATAKQETRKPVKPKPAKKKFVVSAAGSSKKRPLIARRPVSHSSQGSPSLVGSEGPTAREAAVTSQPTRHSHDSQIVEEDEADGDHLEIDNMSTSVSPASVRASGKSQQTYQQTPQQQHQPYQQSFGQMHTYRSSPLSDKAAGKQPVRPSYSSQMERTLSQASESTVVSSMSGSTVASATAGALPEAALSSAPSATPNSASVPPASPLHLPPAQLESSSARVSDSLMSSVGSSVLDMPMASRSTPVTQRRNLSSGSMVRPGGGLIRQSTMSYERGATPRQQIIRAGSTTSLAPLRSPIRTHPPSSASSAFANLGSTSTAVPTTMTASPLAFAAPPMGRSISQDSYGSRPRPFRQNYPSPKLGPMPSTAIAAPSMIAVSGQFMDPEGPDTFSFYSKIGLDNNEEEEEEDDGPELSSSVKGESSVFSSSFTDSQATTQRPLFTPTRPSQTPRIPFARTRSQLNVILDREKERLGEGNYNSWNESRGRDHDSPRRGS